MRSGILALILLLSTLSAESQTFLKKFKAVNNMFALDQKLIIFGDDGKTGIELWAYNKADGTITLIKDFNKSDQAGVSGDAVVMNGFLYFSANTIENGTELWKTDGTTAGTTMVKDIIPNVVGSFGYNDFGSHPRPLLVRDNNLYFVAYGLDYWDAIYKTDGTEAGTFQILSTPTAMTGVESSEANVYMYRNYGGSLSRYNGTSMSTITYPSTGGSSYIIDLEPGDDGAFFVISNSSDVTNFAKLYFFNENTGNVDLVKDLSSSQTITVGNLRFINHQLFFTITTKNVKDELWISDGTAAGTKSILSNSNQTSTPSLTKLYKYNDALIFTRVDTQPHVWITDGTVEETKKLSDAPMLDIIDYWNYTVPPAVNDSFYYFSPNGSIIGLDTDGEKMKFPFTTPITYPYFDSDGGRSIHIVACDGEIYFSGNDRSGLALWSLEPAPEIAVSYKFLYGGFNNILNGSDVAFGTTKVDTCFTAQLTIQNVGYAALNVGDISLSGKDWWLKNKQAAPTLQSQEKITLDILFRPVAEGVRPGTLEITNTDGNESLFSARFIGNGKGFSLRGCVDDGTAVKSIHLGDVPLEAAPAPPMICLAQDKSLGFSINQIVSNSLGQFFAVGGKGIIMKSIDKGQSWSPYWHPSGFDFKSIKVFDNVMFVEAPGYLVIKSEDFGNTWREVGRTIMDERIAYSSFYSSSEGFGTDYSGRLFYTSDGGATWQQRYAFESPSYYSQFLFAADKNTVIYEVSNVKRVTTNGGKTWKEITTPGSTSATTTYAVNGTTWYQLATTGGVYKTTNSGSDWTRIGLMPDAAGGKFAAVNGNEMWAFTTTHLYKSINGGVDWTEKSFGVYTTVGVSGSDLVACSQNYNSRTLFTSNNEGVTFDIIGYYDPRWFYGSSFVSATLGFAHGSQFLYKTTDGGINWNTVNLNTSYNSIYFLDENVGFATEGSGLHRTIDGGKTFTDVHTDGASGYANSYVFLDANNGFVIGRMIARTIDGGETWTNVKDLTSYSGTQLRFVSSQIGYAITNNGTFKTIDGGATWNSVNIVANGISAWFSDENNGIFGLTKGRIRVTSDGGVTSELITTNISGDIIQIEKMPDGKILVVASNSGTNSLWMLADDQYNFILLTSDTNSGRIQIRNNLIYRTNIDGGIGRIEMGQQPTTGFISGDEIVCLGDAAKFIVSGADAVQYEWTFDGPGQFTYDGETAQVITAEAGTFEVGARVLNGCGAGEYTYFQFDVRESASPPEIVGPLTADAKTDIQYSVSSPLAGSSYLWYAAPDAKVTASGNNATMNWKNAGTGTVQLIQKDNASLCSSSATVSVQLNAPPAPPPPPPVVTGLESRPDISIYPNPTAGKVHFQLAGENEEIYLFDSTGRRLAIEGAAEGSLITFDMSSLAVGAYYYMITLSSGEQVKGILIRR